MELTEAQERLANVTPEQRESFLSLTAADQARIVRILLRVAGDRLVDAVDREIAGRQAMQFDAMMREGVNCASA